ncbi:hypothetical protein CEXT_666271 [Caerostris extrusa]|uniref:Uncharacterized protein n=1 Tax=Caerostris extrusa TaxID=172846 RepID=A0AAV4TWX1_CAEEX|nr:hypothetical protein CEXT_666271 [Caerostris extrusa]
MAAALPTLRTTQTVSQPIASDHSAASLRPVLTCAMMLQEEMECANAEGVGSSQDHPRNQPVVHYEYIPNLKSTAKD